MINPAIIKVAGALKSLHWHEIAHELYRYTYVSLDHKYCYFGTPKNGSSYLKSVIHELENLPEIPAVFDMLPDVSLRMKIHIREKFEMLSLAEVTEEEFVSMYDPAFQWITVYRNPFKRILSAWADKILSRAPSYIDYINLHFPNNPNVSFDEFVLHLENLDLETCDCHWRKQNFCGYPNLFPNNRVYSSDQVPEVVNLLESLTGAKSSVEPLNENPIYYDPCMSDYARNQIQTMYADEIKFLEQLDIDCSSLPLGKPKGSLSVTEKAIIDRNEMIKTLFDNHKEFLYESQCIL